MIVGIFHDYVRLRSMNFDMLSTSTVEFNNEREARKFANGVPAKVGDGKTLSVPRGAKRHRKGLKVEIWPYYGKTAWTSE